MCPPLVVAGIMAVASIAGNVAQNRAIDRQAAALAQQNQIRADEISNAAGNELNQRAREARRERAAARASASQAGVNLGSNSFLSFLATSEINQSNDQGLIVYNERVQQRARDASYRSSLNQMQKKTGLGIALDAVGAGLGGYTGAGGTSLFLGKNPGRG